MAITGVSSPDPAQPAMPASARIAIACAAGAALCAMIPLAGWLIGAPLLIALRPGGAMMWPLSAVGYLALAGSFIAAMRNARALALTLLLVPTTLALVAGYERMTGVHAGIDGLLFADRFHLTSSLNPGRPGLVSIGSFLFLSLALALANRPTPRTGRFVALLASLSLAFGTLAAAVSMMSAPSAQPGLADTPLPSALAAILLGLGLLAWRAESGWTGMFVVRAPEWRVLRILFPLILLLPIFSAIVALALSRTGIGSVAATLGMAFVNVAIVAILLIWSATKLLRGRQALEEVTAALNSAPIAIVDRSDSITHWSLGCEQLYGWTADEAIGRRMDDLLQTERPAALSGQAAGLPDAVRAGVDRIDRHRDGHVIHAIEQREPVDLYGRDPVTVIGITDISDRVAIEQELRVTSGRLALAMDAHAVGVFEWDVIAGTLAWTPGSEQRLGVEPGSISDFDSWVQKIEPGDWSAIQVTISEAVARRAPRFTFHYRFRQPNGVVRAIDGSAQAFYDADGRLVRTVGVNVDVTAREDRESMLKAREAQLRSILETVPDAMIVIDEAGTILSFSRAAEQLLGYAADDVVGDTIGLLLPKQHHGRHMALIRRFLGSSERRVIGQSRLLTAVSSGGVEIPVELRVGEARIGSRKLFTGFLRDLRARLDAEERLNTLRSELTHLGRLSAMGEMAAGLAHELNQPLAATVNFLATADMLLTTPTPDTERSRDMIDMASTQALRAGDIIRRLRDFVARQEPEVRGEPVAATIEDAVALVLVGQGQLEVRVDYDLSPEADLMFADRVQVQQVLVNLMRNAVEAMREAGSAPMVLTIASRVVDAETLEISVADTGDGIAGPVLANLYTPFMTTKDEQGMGVGLSICRRIVEAHGGTLVAENLDGGGARFRFTLPMINERELEGP